MRILFFILLVFHLIISSFPAAAIAPQRIISGMPSITEMLYALGLENKIVGVTTNCNFPNQARSKQKVGGFFLNLEKIISLSPDMVIMLEDAQKQDIQKFSEYGVPIYTINPHTINDVKAAMLELGNITGTQKTAKEVVGRINNRLKQVETSVAVAQAEADFILEWKETNPNNENIFEKTDNETIVEYHVINVKKPKALVVIGLNPLIVVGRGTLINDMLRYAGLQNMAGKAHAVYPQYSFENLLSEDPDYLIFPKGLISSNEMKNDSRWGTLSAVKKGRILYVNADILSRPGPRVAEAVEQMARFVYK